MSESDFCNLADQDLRDLSHALDVAVHHINVMSNTASRFIRLEKRALEDVRDQEAA